MDSCFHWEESTLFLHVHIHPRANKNEIIGLHGKALKIKIKSPPVDGEANHCLVLFLAELFNVPQKNINLIKGLKSRDKYLRISLPKPFLPEALRCKLS